MVVSWNYEWRELARILIGGKAYRWESMKVGRWEGVDVGKFESWKV